MTAAESLQGICNLILHNSTRFINQKINIKPELILSLDKRRFINRFTTRLTVTKITRLF
jgi:hypothetical protein